MPLSNKQIFKIADSTECNPDDRGWGPKFSKLEFARAIESAATAPLLAQIAAQEETIRFVERWANHHATKPNTTAEEVLSCIQHYPAIRAITHGYADGQVPATPNPWKQLRELQSHVEQLEAQLAEARKDAERYRWLQANYARGDGYDRIDAALNDGEGDTQLSPAIDAAIAQESNRGPI